MMNSNPTQTIPTIEQTPSDSTKPDLLIDPTNPLAWILVIIMLISSIDEPINAIAKLIQAITAFTKTTKTRQREEDS